MKKKKKEKENKDRWRYYLIGDKDWIVNNFYSYNPEDKMIEAIDTDDANAIYNKLVTDDSSEEEVNVFEMIDQLDERYRSIVWEYYFEGKTLRQIGSSRGYSKQYAHQELQKAIKMLKEIATCSN